ncbi:hypothetical protein Scep_020387 [Stephania cephalantha]|uniref:Uncharacterized protein n=1 Tax=Stephania cephalantha TaxID=152367 RepID=A0AAP0NN50_9MAGN
MGGGGLRLGVTAVHGQGEVDPGSRSGEFWAHRCRARDKLTSSGAASGEDANRMVGGGGERKGSVIGILGNEGKSGILGNGNDGIGKAGGASGEVGVEGNHGNNVDEVVVGNAGVSKRLRAARLMSTLEMASAATRTMTKHCLEPPMLDVN